MNVTARPAGPEPGAIDGATPTERFVAVAETHTGAVFFVGDRAYKLKKPLSFGFLDFTGREARQRACHREVELNSRLAPDVYLGVADVSGPDGELCDHLVVMRRLPAARRLATLVASGAPVDEHLRRLARQLAAFHTGATRSPEIDAAASRDAVLARWEADTEAIGHLPGAIADSAVAERVIALARRYLAGREALFAVRVAQGRARDGHGDLLADDIFCLDDGPRVLDCLEFDDRLRYRDVLGDVAFLVMDLERLGRADLAAMFLAHYQELTADTWPASLAHHYIAHGAHVRALVAGLRYQQGDRESAAPARRLLALTEQHLAAGRVRLVVVGGLPGTGKSTVAGEIGDALGAVVLASDVLRKQLAGLDPTEPAPAPFRQGLYRAEATRAAYSELLSRAGTCLSLGESVVLDATFSDPAWRESARALAAEHAADLDELACVAPLEVMEERIAGRVARGGDASDATPTVVRELARSGAPWPTASTLDTTAPPDEVRRAVLDRLGVPSAASRTREGGPR